MKKVLVILFLLIPSLSVAQNITFPATLTVEFNSSVDHATLISYEMELVGTPPSTPPVVTIPLTACTGSLCRHNFVIPNMGPWALTIYAVSSWGRSVPATTNFAAKNPEPAKIIKVKLAGN